MLQKCSSSSQRLPVMWMVLSCVPPSIMRIKNMCPSVICRLSPWLLLRNSVTGGFLWHSYHRVYYFTLSFPLFTRGPGSGSYQDCGDHTGELIQVGSVSKSGLPILVPSRISIYDLLTWYPDRKCNKMAEKVDNGKDRETKLFQELQNEEGIQCQLQGAALYSSFKSSGLTLDHRQQHWILPPDSDRKIQFVFSGLSYVFSSYWATPASMLEPYHW